MLEHEKKVTEPLFTDKVGNCASVVYDLGIFKHFWPKNIYMNTDMFQNLPEIYQFVLYHFLGAKMF